MMDEGYIKFRLEWTQRAIHYPEALAALNAVRSRCVSRGWIGLYPDGIGFGNISMRVPEGFLISGTQTGHVANLSTEQVALVTQFDLDRNTCWCTGLIKASSESMTHAALYASQPGIRAVIHIHHRAFWEQNRGVRPTTPSSAAYGTSAMAQAIAHCAQEQVMPVIIMAGHEEGVLAYGTSLEAAEQVLVDCMQENMK